MRLENHLVTACGPVPLAASLPVVLVSSKAAPGEPVSMRKALGAKAGSRWDIVCSGWENAASEEPWSLVILARKGFCSRTFQNFHLSFCFVLFTIPGYQNWVRDLNVIQVNLDKNLDWAWLDLLQQASVL